MDCSPRWATPRTPERRTLGGHAARVARRFGRPFLPWQRQVADVAFELLPNGRLAYRRVVVTVPRQQGKTVLVLAALLLRSLGDRDQLSVYAAQSGVEGRRKWRDDWLPMLPAFNALPHMASGAEAIRFPATGSIIRLHSGGEAGLHGASVDFGCLDEAWAYLDNRHEAALMPAMMARANPQLWIVSTQGVAGRSLYLDEQVQRGRQAVEAGIREGIAFFEWSADPAADPADPETWRSCMPALGRVVTEEFVRDAQRSMPAHEFKRAFLNLPSAGAHDAIVPLDLWQALAEPHAPVPPKVSLAVDVAPRGRSAAIAAAGERDGKLCVTVLEQGQGVDWVAPALKQLSARFDTRPWFDAKACQPILRDLWELDAREIGAPDLAESCAFFLRAANERKLRHRGEPELVMALDGATQRPVGVDGWAWNRRSSGVDISPLVACTIAAGTWRWSFGDDK